MKRMTPYQEAQLLHLHLAGDLYYSPKGHKVPAPAWRKMIDALYKNGYMDDKMMLTEKGRKYLDTYRSEIDSQALHYRDNPKMKRNPSASADYREFHGKAPRRSRRVNFHVPKRLTVLGKAIAVEYQCSKLHGGGDGKTAIYRHEFETPMYLCMDEQKGKQLYIVGPNLIVTEAGIEN